MYSIYLIEEKMAVLWPFILLHINKIFFYLDTSGSCPNLSLSSSPFSIQFNTLILGFKKSGNQKSGWRCTIIDNNSKLLWIDTFCSAENIRWETGYCVNDQSSFECQLLNTIRSYGLQFLSHKLPWRIFRKWWWRWPKHTHLIENCY